MRTVVVGVLNLRELIASGVRFEARRLEMYGSYRWLLTTYA